MISEVMTNASRFFGTKFDNAKTKLVDSMKKHPVKTSIAVLGGAGLAAIAMPVAGSITGFTAANYALAHGMAAAPALANIAWAGPATVGSGIVAGFFGGRHIGRTIGESAENSMIGGVVNSLIRDNVSEHAKRKVAKETGTERPKRSVFGKFATDTRNAVLGPDSVINRGLNKIGKVLEPYTGITGKCMIGGLALGTLFGGPVTGAGVATGIGLSSVALIRKMKSVVAQQATPEPETLINNVVEDDIFEGVEDPDAEQVYDTDDQSDHEEPVDETVTVSDASVDSVEDESVADSDIVDSQDEAIEEPVTDAETESVTADVDSDVDDVDLDAIMDVSTPASKPAINVVDTSEPEPVDDNAASIDTSSVVEAEDVVDTQSEPEASVEPVSDTVDAAISDALGATQKSPLEEDLHKGNTIEISLKDTNKRELDDEIIVSENPPLARDVAVPDVDTTETVPLEAYGIPEGSGRANPDDVNSIFAGLDDDDAEGPDTYDGIWYDEF